MRRWQGMAALLPSITRTRSWSRRTGRQGCGVVASVAVALSGCGGNHIVRTTLRDPVGYSGILAIDGARRCTWLASPGADTSTTQVKWAGGAVTDFTQRTVTSAVGHVYAAGSEASGTRLGTFKIDRNCPSPRPAAAVILRPSA